MYRLRGKDWLGRTVWIEVVLGAICITYSYSLAHTATSDNDPLLVSLWKDAKRDYPSYNFGLNVH